MAILLAGLSALLYGAADFCGGLASRRSAVFAVLVFSQACGLLLAVAATAILRTPLPAWTDLAWGAAAGAAGALGIAALYTALATTVVAVASPIAAVVGAVLPLLIGVATGDRPGLLSWIGVGLAFPAILLLTAGPVEKEGGSGVRRAILLGTVAGVGFGVFFAAISRTTQGSGLWPLVAARATTVLFVALFALVTRRPLRLGAGTVPLAVSAGLMDMGANIAFLLASRTDMLTLVAVISSLYPAPTVVLAWIVMREKVTWPRAAGLALSLAGVALIALRG
jgi:drug/metabolite transporter (DMT)-like permease